jgi:hypothetical protein
MKLIHRFIYYFSGFAIGLVLLFFILSGKETSCAYGPDARTLKSILVLEKEYSPEAESFLTTNKLDTTALRQILENGDVDFGKSTVHKDRDSCNIYNVYGDYESKTLEFTIKRCDSLATVKKIAFREP